MITPGDNADKTSSVFILAPGVLIHQYQILERIGAGGMGEVYLVRDSKLDRKLALKFLPSTLSSNEEYTQRFVREARAAAKLHHPNIVTVYDVGEHNNRPFIAMEYVEGRSLAPFIGESTMTTERVIDIAVQLSSALEEAHKSGVVHRDIKPSNIVVDSAGRPRLLDFGLAAMSGESQLTSPGVTLGTIAYMSPEQVRGQTADERSDLFSLGVVIYELCAGKTAFHKDHAGATLNAVLEQKLGRPTCNSQPIRDWLWGVLEKLLDKDPTRRFQSAKELSESLKLGHSADRAGVKSETKSIAVLPFANMSEDPQQEYVCFGIAEDIINDLSHIPGLRVVARTSAFSFKGTNADVREIGQKLNVGTILEGSVRKAGNRLRITAQLINVADGFHLWSERYDREITDIFAIQDDIARAVVETLKGYLLPQDSKAEKSSSEYGAYELCLKGRYLLSQRTHDSFNEALVCFRKALEFDPNNAMARVGLADTYFLLTTYSWIEPRDGIARARASLLRVLDSDDTVAEAHITLGGILTYIDWDWVEAEKQFIRAVELNPGNVTAHQWYGELLMMLGRFDEAETQFQRAISLDPLSSLVHMMFAINLQIAGRTFEAIEHLQKAINLGTENEIAYLALGFALLSTGEKEKGIEQFKLARQMSRDSSTSCAYYGHVCALNGNQEEAKAMYALLQERAKSGYVCRVHLGVISFDCGDRDAAINYFREAVRLHDNELIYVALIPGFENLLNDPDIKPLLGVLGLDRD